MSLKITSWNVEHSQRLIGTGLSNTYADRRDRVAQTIRDIDPDIFCMLEAPKGETEITGFAQDVLNNEWLPVLLPPSSDAQKIRDKAYKLKGTQWIWFLVKADLHSRCRLQSPMVWQDLVGRSKWDVYYWGKDSESNHSHYRHPQVLIVDVDGKELEVIGQHMKSKINKNRLWANPAKTIMTDEYRDEALKARVKLATEARNIRRYIDARFNQSVSPAIVVLGDANDGIGQDYFEERYMFFDLIGNLQGNVMQAERFFNHALFDFPQHLRWTAKYDNKITGKKARDNPLLIDHIIMSQALVRGQFPLQAKPGSGIIEHTAFDRANAGATKNAHTSDHRPLSLTIS